MRAWSRSNDGGGTVTSLPASFYRAEAAYLEPPEPDYEPDFEDGHELPSGHVDARTCWNKDCRYFVQWFCDYEPGDPCEGCGQPLGDEK
jgi:hypothetical protein